MLCGLGACAVTRVGALHRFHRLVTLGGLEQGRKSSENTGCTLEENWAIVGTQTLGSQDSPPLQNLGSFCSFLEASGWLQLSPGGAPDILKVCPACAPRVHCSKSALRKSLVADSGMQKREQPLWTRQCPCLVIPLLSVLITGCRSATRKTVPRRGRRALTPAACTRSFSGAGNDERSSQHEEIGSVLHCDLCPPPPHSCMRKSRIALFVPDPCVVQWLCTVGSADHDVPPVRGSGNPPPIYVAKTQVVSLWGGKGAGARPPLKPKRPQGPHCCSSKERETWSV